MDNPLLDLTGLPHFQSICAEHVEPALDTVLEWNRAERERLFATGRPLTWEQIIDPLEVLDERLARLWSPVAHLHAVRDEEALRAAYNASLPKLSAYHTEVAQDERVYHAYRSVAQSPDARLLAPAQHRILEQALRDFRLAGADLDEARKARFKDIQQQISLLTSRFEQNVLDATRSWELVLTDERDLAGLPESLRALGRDTAECDGRSGWKFTLDGPSYVPFMTYADHRDLRRQMYMAYVTRASGEGPDAGRWDNGLLLPQILALRQEAARLLGFENYAQESLATKMARREDRVLGFLNDLALRSHPAAVREFAELKDFARTLGRDMLEAWDVAYYSEKLRVERYAFSEEEVRAYFPEPRVIEGMFEVVRRLYGVTIREIDGVEVWHPDVRFYEIRDESGAVRGRFYTDLYARPDKRGGAWMDECIVRKRSDGGVQVPVAYLTCNFARPVGGKPSLLSHDEVTTLFHEFGHGLHHMLTLVDYPGAAGINGVEWDAVELPSQFMENWCWQREALDVIAGHFVTGERLPSALFEKMHAARNFQSAMQMVRQLEFGLFDMRVHAEYDGGGEAAIQAILDDVRHQVAVVIPPASNRFQNSFTHIFSGGYAAGYYGYKWAEVLSADAFSKFEERGIFDSVTGREFLHHILEQGGSREPMELFVEFRGREPSIDPLLRHNGLVP
ncbi:MAG: M3 family metallopeptidase [Acidiferrobacteraceae bacterium]